MRIKTYESYGVDKDMELVEDIFQEIYDKYKIKKIPSDKVATDFMTRVEDNSIYYQIEKNNSGILFRIYQNKLQLQGFNELVKNCIKILERLKKFNLKYDIKFDTRAIQNPYNFGVLNTFTLVLFKL